MVKIKWIKKWKKRNPGDISNASKKSAENFVSQGYAEYINENIENSVKIKKKKTKKQEEKPKELPEIEIRNKIKEISDLENPLEAEKEIKALSKETSYSIQVLRKQVNYLRKCKKKVSVTLDTLDTLDTLVTLDTHLSKEDYVTCVSSVSIYHSLFLEVLGDSVVEQIIKHIFLEKRGLTVGELALKTGKTEVHIRNTISKNRQYFDTLKPNGKIGVTLVTHQAVQDIKQKIDELRQIQAQQEQKRKELEAKEAKEKEHILEVKEYLMKNKPKREGMFILIDYQDVLNYSSELADLLLEKTHKFIEQVETHFSDKLSVKIVNFPELSQINIEDIRKEHLETLLCIEGRVTSIGEVRPVTTKIVFSCPSCGTLISKIQNYRTGYLEEPTRCSCGRRGGLHLENKEETNACFIQLEDLQDKTDNPQSRRMKGVLFKSLCDISTIKKFTPGNEVRVTGVLKEVPIRKGSKISLFSDWIFEINDVELIEKDININEFEEETIQEIKLLASRIDKEGISCLDSSFAPEVYGYEEIKHALMLQLSNRRNDVKNKSTRNKSNILLIGDPGIAKTVLGKFAVKVSSGAREAVGGGSSAVGITASVIKEEDSMGGYRVEPGAMVLAKDLLFLDELNNLSDEDKPKLQEGMSEQRVSINKANLHVQMKVSCGILAVANPLFGHFKPDAKESMAEQFNIPTPILNRFDTVFMMIDNVNGEYDKKIAEIMMKRHNGRLNIEYSPKFLKKFLAYVRHSDEPEIEDDIAQIMKEIYFECRKTYNAGVKINPRFFESLTRMSCASAKMRLSNKVELKDIKIALRILSQSQYKINELILENNFK